MFGKKKLTNLSTDDLGELKARVKMINEYGLVAQALELQRRLFLNGCLQKLGLDLDKRYEIDFKSGAITLAEEPKDEPTGTKKNPQ